MAETPKNAPTNTQTSSGATEPTPSTPQNTTIEGSSRPATASYWKGRNFPPRPGSKRAQTAPKRTTSNAPADLRPRKMLQPVVSALSEGASRATDVANDKQLQLVEALKEFEAFREALLPALIGDINAGLTAEQIMKKYQAVAAARLVSLLPNLNPKFAASAASQILDRTMGKAVERKQVAHAFADLTERELDSLIISTLKETEDDSD